MLVYFSCYIIIMIQSIILNLSKRIPNEKKQKIIVTLSCVELITIMGLRRFDVGADTKVYVSALIDYSQFKLEDLLEVGLIYPYKFEWGYLWLTKLCAMINMDYSLFLLLIGVLIYVQQFKTIERFSPIPTLSISIYFGLGLFSYSLGIFRQFIAISIILIGFRYIIEMNFKKWCSIVMVAMLFHTSSLICLPMYFLSRISFNKLFLLSLISQPILVIYGKSILELAFKQFTFYVGYTTSINVADSGTHTMIYIYNMLLIMVYFYQNYFRKDNSSYLSFFCNCIPIVSCLQVLSYNLVIFGRVIPYYSFFIILLIPCIINDIFEKSERFVLSLMLNLAFLGLFFYRTTNDAHITPFYFFWN